MPIGPPSISKEYLDQFRRKHPEIKYLRFQWQDYSGILRGRVILIDTAMVQIANGSPLKATGMALGICVANKLIPTVPFDG